MRLLVTLLVGACLISAAAEAKGLPVKTKSIDKSSDSYEISIEYPATGLAAIDREIADWAKREAAEFVELSTTDRAAGESAYSLDVSFEVARNDSEVFAVLFSEDTATGGAHPNHDFATFNFEARDGWRLYLPEMFDGNKALARISALAIADLTRQFEDEGGGDTDTVKDGAGPDWDNFRNFILQKDTLELHYPPYQVAAYAAGEQETDIPLAALQGFERANRRAPVASFECAASGTPIEKAICGDIGLARADRDLAEAYRLALRIAESSAAKDKLKSEQRAWLEQRNATCKAAIPCLTSAYQDRLAKLKKFPD